MLEIIVPATTANIGPGFDTLGLALNLYNKFYITEIENGLEITGCDDDYKNENNLIYTSMQYFYNKVKPDKIPTGVKIDICTNIPLGRGLGSSATCIIAGVIAANILSESNLSKKEILNIATEIEGHPDNIAPALFGNMIVSLYENNEVYYNVLDIPDELIFCAIIPDFELSTSLARSVLPSEIPHKDGVYNISRVSLLISSLINKNFDLIKIACHDKLHQIYRSPLIENYNDIVSKLYNLESIGVFLSGSGPTIMSIVLNDNYTFSDSIKSFLLTLNNTWEIKILKCDKQGTKVNII